MGRECACPREYMRVCVPEIRCEVRAVRAKGKAGDLCVSGSSVCSVAVIYYLL